MNLKHLAFFSLLLIQHMYHKTDPVNDLIPELETLEISNTNAPSLKDLCAKQLSLNIASAYTQGTQEDRAQARAVHEMFFCNDDPGFSEIGDAILHNLENICESPNFVYGGVVKNEQIPSGLRQKLADQSLDALRIIKGLAPDTPWYTSPHNTFEAKIGDRTITLRSPLIKTTIKTLWNISIFLHILEKIVCVNFSHDERFIVACTTHNNLIVWDTNTAKLLCKLKVPCQTLFAADFLEGQNHTIVALADTYSGYQLLIFENSFNNPHDAFYFLQKTVRSLP